ncbi:hypothetical protein GW17_00040848 [Ensete ventricosum]|nr:hypothetical protein GW17_00040848 [Ensete ventricosum]RZS27026.1 hypothetical protein BHM03_00060458 [Ensete ventricosum]
MPTMAAAAASKLVRIDAMQSAMPGRMTPPGRSRRIFAATPLGPDVLQRRCQVVLYYSEVGEGKEAESRVTVGAWMKESLSEVLSSHPVLAGRLRRDDEGRGCWEIKFNDCGVRLVQATAEVTLSEFLCSEYRDEREANLAYWEDVNADNPNYSPLFFIQVCLFRHAMQLRQCTYHRDCHCLLLLHVTQFQGDGYSIGISCSLLLADPFVLARFLKSWAQTHTTMFAHGQLTNPPIHLCYFQTSGHPPCHSNSNSTAISAAASVIATTTLFKVARNSCATNAAAATCFQEAARRLGTKPASSYSLVISDSSVYLTVESAGFDEVVGCSATEVAWRDQLGIEEISLVEARKPVHASCRIVPCAGETLVVVMQPSEEDELMVSVTTPADKI